MISKANVGEIVAQLKTYGDFCEDFSALEKAGAGAVQTFPPAGDAHMLAGRAEGDDVHRLYICAVHFGYIAVMLHKGLPLCGHPDGEWFDLRSPHRQSPVFLPLWITRLS